MQTSNRRLFVAFIIGSLLTISGCHESSHTDVGNVDNGTVLIHNNTDRSIRIFYAVEISDPEIQVEQHSIVISSGSSRTVDIRSHFWDGEFTAVYGGIVMVYDAHFDIFDYDAVDVYIDDFTTFAQSFSTPP